MQSSNKQIQQKCLKIYSSGLSRFAEIDMKLPLFLISYV